MRVLQLGPYPPPHGGIQTNLVAIRQYLRQKGVLCPVINITRHRKQDADDVYYPGSALQLLWRMLRLRCDIIHLHFGGELTLRLVALAFLCTLIPGAKTLLTFHSGGYPLSPAGMKACSRSLRGFVLRRLDCVIAVNLSLVEFFQRLGIEPTKIHLIEPHATGLARPADSLPRIIDEFIRAHSKVITSVGLLESEYELPLQIETLGLLRRRFPSTGLLIIGSGSLENALRRIVATKSYSQHVLLAGDVPHAQTLKAIEQSSVILRTTRFDGDSISVREALQLGVPVIATDNGMRPEEVRLIPGADITALSSKIEEVLSEENPRPARPEAGARNVEAVFDVYRSLMGEAGFVVGDCQTEYL